LDDSDHLLLPGNFPLKIDTAIEIVVEAETTQETNTKAPMFFIHGDADGVRLEHISEMFRLKGDDIFGDMRPRSTSRLAILPNTTHVTLMERMPVIVPMVNDLFDAKPHKQ
jgi:hypothetical protein